MYSVVWKKDQCQCAIRTNSWYKALEVYQSHYNEPDVSDLYIRDNEYRVRFVDYNWEKDQ